MTSSNPHDAWETCRIGSCHRHQKCMYGPCRNISVDHGPAMTRPVSDDVLLPCPFPHEGRLPPVLSGYCLGTAEELQTTADQWAYTVRCSCGAQGPVEDTEAEAIAAWNKRAAIASLEPEMERAWIAGFRYGTMLYSSSPLPSAEEDGLARFRAALKEIDHG